MISTSPIKISCVISRRPGARTRSGRCTTRSSSARTRSAREDPTGAEHRPTVSPCSGDGAIPSRGASAPPAPSARRSSRCSPSAGFPAAEVVPFASERSAGQQGRVRRRRARVPAAERRVDPGPRPRALLGRRHGQRRVGAEAGRGRRGRRRQHQLLAHARRRAAGRRRGQRRRASTATTGIVANPNCTTMQMMIALKPIHDAAGLERADRLHLPVGLRHRPERRSRSCASSPRPCSRASEIERARSIRTRSPSTSCPRSRPSRTATTTRPRSAR